jgi:drug/metabolite transporter (DMT)-like permease
MPEQPSRAAVVAAFAAVYFIWGSTYLAIAIAIETLPALTMAGVRFILAGGAVMAWRRARGDAWPTRRQWAAGALVGGLLFVGGNGGVCWAEQHVASGLVALLVASVPSWMVLFDWMRPGGRWPGQLVLAGVVVGFVGVGLLVAPRSGKDAVDLSAAGVVLAGSACWALGSLRSRRTHLLPPSPAMSVGLQMATGGGLLLVAGAALGEPARVDLAAVSTRSVLAVLYLCILGSLVAFSAYSFLLRTVSPASAATYAYVNPVVAVALGSLAGEALTGRMLLAGAIIVGGVAMITLGRTRAPAAA